MDSGPQGLSRMPSADSRRRPALGRGLGALLGRESFEDDLVKDLPIHEIQAGRFQPRRAVGQESLAELIDSIRDRGVLQPIVVRPVAEGYELVAGERRWRAALAAGLEVIPAVLRQLTDQECLEIGLLENLQREDLNPIERARAYQRLREEFGLSQEEIALRLRKAQPTIANTLRLLQLPVEVQTSVEQGRLTEGHARALLSLADVDRLLGAWREVERRGLSVRETEVLVKRAGTSRGKPHRRAGADPNLLAIEETLSERFQTRVAIAAGRRRGRIVIEFYSADDLDRILAFLLPGSPTDVKPAFLGDHQ